MPLKKVKSLFSNKPIEATATFLSLIAIILSVMSYLRSDVVAKASIRPLLDISARIADINHDGWKADGTCGFVPTNDVFAGDPRGLRVDNSGTGPAIITSIEFFANGAPSIPNSNYSGDNKYTAVLRDVGLNERREGQNGDDSVSGCGVPVINSIESGNTIANGNELFIFSYKRNLISKEKENLKTIGIRIIYESMLGEKQCVLYRNDPDGKLSPFVRKRACFNWKAR